MTYTIFKYLHILFVVGWLGGGLAMVLLGLRATRAQDDADLIRVIRNVVYLAKRVFVPFSVLALLAGLVMVYLADWWTSLWVILGLIGFAATAGTGAAILTPRSERVLALADKDGPSPEAVRGAREILSIAQFDMVMLAVVIADMVLKPGFEDYITLLVMVVVLVAAAAYFLMPLRSAQPARA
jgi:uncharacterized membrane protein